MGKEKERLNVGIAGYGIVGQRRRHFIDQHPALRTIAVCDQKFPESGTLSEGVKCFKTYQDLIDQPLDILFVCLPTYLAAEATIAGLQRDLHVFCEKPPGRDVRDIENVISVEKTKPRLLLKYGFNHRYHNSVREAVRLVKSGELGEIINMRGVYGKSRLVQFSGGWRAERQYAGGGILLDQGIHLVDLMQLFCGDFVEVKSYISNSFWRHDVEDNAYALMRDSRGRIAMLHSSATQWQHRFSLDIALTKGFLVLRGILSGSKSYGEEELVVGKCDESNVGSTREECTKYLEDESWRLEIQEFADAILKKGEIVNGKSSEALKTMELVYRIYRADPEWRDSCLTERR